MPEPPADWPAFQKHALEYEAFLAEVLKQRAQTRPAGPNRKWKWLLNSNVATALVSLLLTAVLGNLTLAWVQKRNKDHEFKLLAYKEHLAAQLKTVERVYHLVGGVRAAAQDLITVTQPEFSLDRFTGKDARSVRDQVLEVQDRYSKTDQQWRAEREALGFLMVYHHHGRPEVLTAWENMQGALDTYTACAEKWHNSHIGKPASPNLPLPCQRELAETTRLFTAMTLRLAEAQSASRP